MKGDLVWNMGKVKYLSDLEIIWNVKVNIIYKVEILYKKIDRSMNIAESLPHPVYPHNTRD